MKRKFYLENEKGQQFDLNNFENGCLLTSPSNLGYSYSSEFEQVGSTFIENNRKIDKKDPSGIANFKNYDKCKEFIDFVEKSEILRWIYTIPSESGNKSYYRDVTIKSFDKTEKSIGRISCPITFNGISLWYEENTAVYTIGSANEIKWDFKWDSSFVDLDVRRLQYINNGHVEAPVKIEIAKVTNPKITLYVDGQLIQEVPIKIGIGDYEKLLYCSKENDFYIYKQNIDGSLQSLFSNDYIDFPNDNVIRIPKNHSCELLLTADTEIESAQITIFTYYNAI